MKTKRNQIILLLLTCLPTFLLFAQQFNPEVLARVDSIFHVQFSENEPGSAFAVIKKGKVVYKNTKGMANMEFRVRITDSTVFNIASNSKHMTTFLVLLMADEGKFSLEDDVRDHLPELAHLEHKITLKQLTNHTHGLPNVDELEQFKDLGDMTHATVLDMLFEIQTFNFNPGEDYVYSNTGYVLLSEIIARKGEKPFEVLLHEYLFSKLGMNSQAVGNFNQIVPNLADSYTQTSEGFQKNPVKSSTMGASGVHACLNDLIAWAKHFYNPKVGKPSYWKEMVKPTVLNSGKTIDYGMGLQFEKYKGIDIVFHGGGTASYRSYMLHVPEEQLSLVFLANEGSFSGLDVVYGSLEAILENLIQEETPTFETPLSQYEGTYQLNPGAYYTIFAEKDSLFWQSHGSNERLFLPRKNNNTFSFPVLPYTTLKFYDDRFDFRISDFNYPSPRITPPSLEIKDESLKKYVGIYQNKAHNVIYELAWEKEKLVAYIPGDIRIVLDPFSENSVYGKNSFFGRLVFSFNSENKVSGFILSRQNLTNIPFVKRCENAK
ncbi:MAG: serine hydrolase domain-containing protein [Bacteroidota bacterium]